MNIIRKVAGATLAELPEARQRIVEEGRATLDERLDQGKPINPSGSGERGVTSRPRTPKPGTDRDR